MKITNYFVLLVSEIPSNAGLVEKGLMTFKWVYRCPAFTQFLLLKLCTSFTVKNEESEIFELGHC